MKQCGRATNNCGAISAPVGVDRMEMQSWRFYLGVVLAGLTWAGCRHAASSSPPAGQSSIRFVAAPAEAPVGESEFAVKAGPPRELFRDATPVGLLATPIYPPVALAAHAGQMTVGARITVDAAGRVSNVGPSLVALSIPSRFSNEFQAAVEAAVAQWRFQPARILYLEQAPDGDGGTYSRVAREEKTDTYFDVVFTFTASGEVLPAMVDTGK